MKIEGNTRNQERSACTRSGMSTVEYIAVSCVLILFAMSSVYIVGQSANSVLDSVADKLADPDASPETYQVADAAGAPPAASPTSKLANVSLFQWILLAMSFCFALVGIRILTYGYGRKLTKKIREQEVEVHATRCQALEHVIEKRNSIHSLLLNDWSMVFRGCETIGPLMSTNLVTVRPSLSKEECAALLDENGFRRVMVTHEDGRMAGVASKKDLTKPGSTVADVMTDDPVTASPDTEVKIALTMLIQRRVSCLPVIDDGRLVGLLSTSDLLVSFQCLLTILGDMSNQLATRQGELSIDQPSSPTQVPFPSGLGAGANFPQHVSG